MNRQTPYSLTPYSLTLYSLTPYLLIAGIAVTALSISLEAPQALRLPVMLTFLLLVPGMSFVPLLRLPQKGYEFTLAVAVSLLLEALITTVLVELQRYSLELSLEVLGSLSLIGCGLQIWWPGAADQNDPLELEADELEMNELETGELETGELETGERNWVAQ